MVLFAENEGSLGLLRPESFADRHDEACIQAWADASPEIVNGGHPLISLGREIVTRHGHLIDNLFLDQDGALFVVEMKRGRTPRTVVAQVIDYAAHVSRLDWPEVDALCRDRQGCGVDEAFRRVFGRTLPRERTPAHRLAILAESYDPQAMDAALYLINAGTPLVLLQFTCFRVGGRGVLDIRPVLGTLPEPGIVSAEDGADGYDAWLLGSVEQALPGLAQDQGWALRCRRNKQTLPFGCSDWPLSLGDCQLRVDTYKRDAVSLRLAFRRECAPGLQEFVECRRADWVDGFPAAFETPPYATVFACLTRDMPRPEMGEPERIEEIVSAVRGMTDGLLPVIGRYFAEQGGGDDGGMDEGAARQALAGGAGEPLSERLEYGRNGG